MPTTSPPILDFSLVSGLEAPGVFYKGPSECVPAILHLPQTCARAEAAAYFVFKLYAMSSALHDEPEEDVRRRG